MHLHVGEAQLSQIGGAQLDHLKVDPWSTVADRLDIELRKLAISPLLWSVVPEKLRNSGKSNRLWLRAHPVLDVGANGAGSGLGTECQRDRIITTRLKSI